jgi:hypothetical protein
MSGKKRDADLRRQIDEIEQAQAILDFRQRLDRVERVTIFPGTVVRVSSSGT